MTDTTDLLEAGNVADTPAQDTAAAPPTRVRRRATSGGGLASLILPELQSLASDLGISGVARLRKSQLIDAIQERQGTAAAKPATDAAEDAATAGNGAAATGPAAAAGRPTSARRAAGTRADSDRTAAVTPAPETVTRSTEATAADGDASGDSDSGAPGAAAAEQAAGGGGAEAESSGNERLDRSRERFLEREARRQERAAAQAAASVEGDGSDQPAPGDRASYDRQQSDRQQSDRQQSDRATYDRQQGDRPVRDRQPVARQLGQDRDGVGPAREDEDEFGSRRGRFRERGRGRNRNPRDRFAAGESDPVVSDDDVLIPIGGILDILDSYGFIRTSGYLTGPNDVYVSLQQVRRYGLRRGDAVTGAVRQQREGERKDKYNALVRLDSVNGVDPAEAHTRPEFTKLTPLYPQDRLRLETSPDVLTTRVIDLVMPVGKGQRALIVSPPKAGKTMVMQAIANAITTNNPEVHLMVVLVDERPEEVTDMQRSVKGEVIASTFDRPPQDHITVAELSIERAKRLVELGHDVVVLLDSITRLGRAYNLGAPASGRILTGGVDSAALYPPKRFLGAARNIENGGSLTIFATALVETGSAMDTVIFEEFKGTGNAELKLDRRLADKRICPAIVVDASGTRKEEILLAPQELRIILQLRRVLHALDTASSLELLLDKMKATRTNVEFLMQIQKTTADPD